ncbi:hypothetical protein, partial [Methylorubrum extorquens]
MIARIGNYRADARARPDVEVGAGVLGRLPACKRFKSNLCPHPRRPLRVENCHWLPAHERTDELSALMPQVFGQALPPGSTISASPFTLSPWRTGQG